MEKVKLILPCLSLTLSFNNNFPNDSTTNVKKASTFSKQKWLLLQKIMEKNSIVTVKAPTDFTKLQSHQKVSNYGAYEALLAECSNLPLPLLQVNLPCLPPLPSLQISVSPPPTDACTKVRELVGLAGSVSGCSGLLLSRRSRSWRRPGLPRSLLPEQSSPMTRQYFKNSNLVFRQKGQRGD